MKLYWITWTTNYGAGTALIQAISEEDCRRQCKSGRGIWDNYDIEEVILTDKSCILLINS